MASAELPLLAVAFAALMVSASLRLCILTIQIISHDAVFPHFLSFFFGVSCVAYLHSSFLQTPPHGDALGVCAYLPLASNFVTFHNVTWNTYRGLEPHEFTPMPGVHKTLQGTSGQRSFSEFNLATIVSGQSK